MKTVQLMSNFAFLGVFISTGKSSKKLMAKSLIRISTEQFKVDR